MGGARVAPFPIPKSCPYCGNKVSLRSNAAIYGRKYGNGKCYKCRGCDAYVGVHTGTVIPLGRLADKELRELKITCHKLFDPSWKGPDKQIKRGEAYEVLAALLGIPAIECHFGWFDKPLLQRCLEILENPRWYLCDAA